MGGLTRTVLALPGRGVNKIGDWAGLGPNNTIRNLSGSAQMAKAIDSGKPLTARQIVNPSGKGNVFDPAGGFGLGDHSNSAPVAPPTAPVTPMPDQEAIDAAARRARQRQLGRGGFASTILSAASGGQSQGSDRLGP